MAATPATLARLRALLAKCAKDSGCTEDEARTSALIACRLILEHKLLGAPEGEEADSRPPPPPRGRRKKAQPPPADPRGPAPSAEGSWDEFDRRYGARARGGSSGGTYTGSGEVPDFGEPFAWGDHSSRVRVDRIHITSKYRGTCTRCKTDYQVGEEIIWHKRQGAWHVRCA